MADETNKRLIEDGENVSFSSSPRNFKLNALRNTYHIRKHTHLTFLIILKMLSTRVLI